MQHEENFTYNLRLSPAYLGLKIAVVVATFLFLHIMLTIGVLWLNSRSPVDIPVGILFLLYPFGIVLIIYAILDYFALSYEINSEEIIVRKGIFNIHENRFSINNIERVMVYQSVIGRVLNYGDILINNLISDEDINIYNVPSPKFYADKVFDTIKSDGLVDAVRVKPKRLLGTIHKHIIEKRTGN